MNPKKALEYYSRIYPSVWKQVDAFRAARGKDLPFWPEWCFMPLAGAYAIVSAEAEKQEIDITREGMPLINDVGIIGALAAWRVTQGVYRFDQEVYRAVIETPLTGDLPHDVLFNLPLKGKSFILELAGRQKRIFVRDSGHANLVVFLRDIFYSRKMQFFILCTALVLIL